MLNTYFPENTFSNINEQELLNSLDIERIQILGNDFYYIKRSFTNIDDLFGEDPLSKFEKKVKIEMFWGTNTGFGGDGVIQTPFGEIESKTVDLIVSDTRFKEEFDKGDGSYVRPMEGDYIYSPVNGDIYEILFANHEKRFWQYGKVYFWNLHCEKVKYSSEKINTGIAEIDSVGTRNSLVQGGSITIKLIQGGWKYTSSPTIAIVGGGGTGAIAVATVSNGKVDAIYVTSSGTGYISIPEIQIIANNVDAYGAKALAILNNPNPDPIDNSDKIQSDQSEFLNFLELDPRSLDGKL